MASLIACSLTLSKSRSVAVTKIEQPVVSHMELKNDDSPLGNDVLRQSCSVG